MHVLPRIPGYELIQMLGGGPVTRVYSARDRETDASCAIKLIRADWDDRITAVKLLQREARAGLSVRHPHLVRFDYAHVTSEPYFLVMELLAGETLRRRLRRDYCLDLAASLWIARQSAEALASLHQAGFVHGDVKPDNIRLVSSGTAKLIDLGFAHRPGENLQLLKKGYVLGTANYLAPELCASGDHGSFSADVYSLGMTLFEMLTGRLPFPPGSLEETFHRHMHQSPDDLRLHLRAAPDALATLLDRMLARDPNARPRVTAVIQQLVGLEIATLRRRRSA